MRRFIALAFAAAATASCGSAVEFPEPAAGDEHGSCYGNGTCNATLTCRDGRCARGVAGTEGNACYGNGTCNAGLECLASICRMAADASVDSGAPDTSVADTVLPETAPVDAADASDASDAAATFDTFVPDTGTATYEKSTVAFNCDALPDGTIVDGLGGEDAVTAFTTLPFAFPYFGVAANFVCISSNGFLQLSQAPLPAPSSSPNNVAIPTTAAPNAVIAPFWDDLSPIASDVRATTLGSGDTRRFVVQWTHWTMKTNNAVRFTFQAKLFESGTVEYHYCAMSVDGATSATIGLENWSGTTGVQHAFNVAIAAPTGSALRFTPK